MKTSALLPARVGFLAALALAWLAAYGCTSSPKEGSESHFLKCTIDADCPVTSRCVARVCEERRPLRDAGIAVDAASDARDSGRPVLPRDSGTHAHQDVEQPDAEPPVCERTADGGWTTNLRGFCAMLAKKPASYIQCPKSRAAILAAIPARCGQVNEPKYFRACGLDVVLLDASQAIELFNALTALYFDPVTGEFVGGLFTLQDRTWDGLPCAHRGTMFDGGTMQVEVGRTVPVTCGATRNCDLCVSDPTLCPPEITAELPAPACGPPPQTEDACDCNTFSPKNGTLCSASPTCVDCGDAVLCGSHCHCMRDGNYRFRSFCFE